jgi:hypothetical protein
LNAAQRARLAAPVAPMPPAPAPYVAPTPAPNPPAPPPSVPTVTPQSPATPAAPSPPPAAKGFTPAELAAMTPTEIAALTAAQINGFGAAQLGALRMDYSSMLSLLEADAGGGITAAEFNALKALVDKFNVPGGIQVSAYLQQIADNVVLGHDANASWTGGASPHALGNMAAGSSALQADELIGKWFLGTDLPEAKVNVTGAPNFTVSHAAVTKELFGANGPGMQDVNQGRLGDCFVMAPLAAMAAMDPASIRAMLTDNGNGTWGVRFFVDGKAQYVTVDNELANGGAIFTSGGNDWAALIEKAYAQLQGGGNTTGTDISFGNSYSSIANGGSPAVTLAEFTGADTITQFIASGGGWTTYVFDGKSLTAENNHGRGTVLSSRDGLATAAVQKDLIADLAAGQELVLSSYADHVDADGKTTLVANHAMTITGFDAATQMFEIYNPWGTAGGGQYWDSSFEASLGSLLADGDVISVAGKSPLLASNPASLVPGAGQPSAGLGLAAAGF